MSSSIQAESIGSKFLKEIKASLNSPARDDSAWAAMSVNDRSLLVRSAALSGETVNFTWAMINPASQQKIREAAKRAAAWVNKLELV